MSKKKKKKKKRLAGPASYAPRKLKKPRYRSEPISNSPYSPHRIIRVKDD